MTGLPLRHRALIAALSAVLVLAATVAVAPRPAGASQRYGRHAGRHSCQGFVHRPPHVAVWKDYRSERSPLVRNIGRLICSAGNGSTIDLKSWFFKINDSVTQRLVHRLRIMHRYHHVKVHVFVGRNANGVDWPQFFDYFDFASVGWCHRACSATYRYGVSHSKWITVSRLRDGRPAVFSTSANWSHQQFAEVEQSGIFVAGNRKLYNDFVERWNLYERCFRRGCSKVVGPSGWEHAGLFGVHFAPSSNDAIAEQLSSVRCGRGGHVWLASLIFKRPEVLDQLTRLIGTGCDVRLLIARPYVHNKSGRIRPRHLREHDKFVVVWSGNRHEVMAGSEDLGTHEMTGYDNQMLLARVRSVVHSYDALFLHQWRMARPVPSSAHIAHVDVREAA